MAKYKLVEMADMDKTGTRKVYPKMVTYRTLSTEEFIKKMKWYNNALPTSAIEAALTDMCNILARMLAMGTMSTWMDWEPFRCPWGSKTKNLQRCSMTMTRWRIVQWE